MSLLAECSAVPLVPLERLPSKPFPIVGVGASAGGLEAFASFLEALPPDTGMTFVLVQHMDPTHESLLNRLLAKDTPMPVMQVKDGMTVKRNCVYVIPPEHEDDDPWREVTARRAPRGERPATLPLIPSFLPLPKTSRAWR